MRRRSVCSVVGFLQSDGGFRPFRAIVPVLVRIVNLLVEVSEHTTRARCTSGSATALSGTGAQRLVVLILRR
jgi:hypothetical protein